LQIHDPTVKFRPLARKARLEIEGGLYHVITRGNDRQEIFHSEEALIAAVGLFTRVHAAFPKGK
jgi:REP element-mobilizing transposase RayT